MFLLSDSSPCTQEAHSKCIQQSSAACYKYVTEHVSIVVCDIVVHILLKIILLESVLDKSRVT